MERYGDLMTPQYCSITINYAIKCASLTVENRQQTFVFKTCDLLMSVLIKLCCLKSPYRYVYFGWCLIRCILIARKGNFPGFSTGLTGRSTRPVAISVTTLMIAGLCQVFGLVIRRCGRGFESHLYSDFSDYV